MRYFLKVYGCQMNRYDGQLIDAILRSSGHKPVNDPEDAEVIIINTCAVRDHAERRVRGYIRTLPRDKRVAVVGCMAQREGRRLIEDLEVNYVLGPDTYTILPRILTSARRFVATELDGELYDTVFPSHHGVVAMVTVMRGCDNWCSYCIVPYVRGRARSKKAVSILSEVEHAVSQGAKEVVLLGQDITSYRDGRVSLADLLRMVAKIRGLERVRFITSHPKGVCDHLIKVVAEEDKICPHFHLPLQSGSNRILRLMNRNYTIEEYDDLINQLRKEIPEVGITTDLIVGFPTETDLDYEATLEEVTRIRFDFAYMFRYSDRPGTAAEELSPKVSEDEKKERLNRLIRIQNRITKDKNSSIVGQKKEVLIERKGRRGYLGRTPENTVVAVQDQVAIGDLVEVEITGISGWTPVGQRLPSKIHQRS